MEPTNNTPTPPLANQSAPTDLPPQPITNSTPSNKKNLIFIVVAVVVALLLAAGGLWWWAGNASSQFVNAVPGYETKAKESYDYFMSLSDRLTHGDDIKKKFEQTVATAPQEPKLLWISPAPADKVKRVADLTSAMQTFAVAYKAAADVSAYSEKSLAIMGGVTGRIKTPSDMEDIKGKLQIARDSVVALTPPAEAKGMHEEILKAYDTVIGDIDTALTALSKNEAEAYTDAVQKLATDIKTVTPHFMGPKLEEVFNATYDKADKAFSDLQKLLGVETD